MCELPLMTDYYIPAVFQAGCDVICIRIHFENQQPLIVTKPNQIHETQQQTTNYSIQRIENLS
jgi:hypothetical protein